MRALFSDYSWVEVWGPFHMAAIVFLVYMYHRRVMHSLYRTTTKQAVCFYLAMVLAYAVLGSPFAVLAGHYVFSAHMVQLAVLFYVVSPLIILSLPHPFLRRIHWNHRRKHLIELLSHPWVSLLLFNGLLTIYLVPSVFNILQATSVLLFLAQAVLFITSLLMWWVILDPMPGRNPLTSFKRIKYMLLAVAFLLPIGIYLAAIMEVHYPIYASVAGDIIPGLTAIRDQQLASGLLKLFQLASFGVAVIPIVRQGRDKDGGGARQDDDPNVRIVQGIPIRIPPGREKD